MTMSLRLWRDTFNGVLNSLSDGVYIVDRKQRLRHWNGAAQGMAGDVRLQVGGPLPCRELQLCERETGIPACTGGCPVAATLLDGRAREAATYIRDASGRKIPARIQTTPLRDRANSIIGAVETVSETWTSAWAMSRIAELEEVAYVDPLTEVASRRFLELQLRRSLGELERFNWRFGVVILDLDDFKRVNDAHGHRVGDAVLRTVANTLASNARPFDVIGRWGGDEFLAVIKNVSEEQLEFVAHKLRSAIRRVSLAAGDTPLCVSASAGATVASRRDTADSLVARADERMYDGKALAQKRHATEDPPAATAEPAADVQD